MKKISEKVYLINGNTLVKKALGKDYIEKLAQKPLDEAKAEQGSIAYKILKKHNKSEDMGSLKVSFDALASHDITYVSIIQTARASGMERFPLPYVLTNCHNSLCAVGGTINNDDQRFGLSAAIKYGGEFVPAHLAVIHQYMREVYASPEKMILGSDSHTRYGALGCLAVGEGGGELVKQLLKKTWDLKRPNTIAIVLKGKPNPGVGPQDVALHIIGSVFKDGFVKNKIMEFVGDGVHNLSMDFRMGVDVMTTETACLSSVWLTDDKVKDFLVRHGRSDEFKQLNPDNIALYDGAIEIELSEVKPMIALPMHPANCFTIEELLSNAKDILSNCEKECERLTGHKANLLQKVKNGKVYVDQGIVAGCSGGMYENIYQVNETLKKGHVGNSSFALSVYPSSQPIMLALEKQGINYELMQQGVILKTAFCGPCFGAGDVPFNDGLSIRHTTRNFPNREGSKPSNGQMAYVALMDARSIAKTASMGGVLTPADENFEANLPEFDDKPYRARVYRGFGKANEESELVLGPNIKDWPKFKPLKKNLLMRVASLIEDEVTTTDELIPSGETSSYRSNPIALAEFALSRRDPDYVKRAKAALEISADEDTSVGSVIYAKMPGDGSAREQAASSQRVLGGVANIAKSYATKRYRSNLINWGMIPFELEDAPNFSIGDDIYIPNVKEGIERGDTEFTALVPSKDIRLTLKLSPLSEEEKRIILAGGLINLRD